MLLLRDILILKQQTCMQNGFQDYLPGTDFNLGWVGLSLFDRKVTRFENKLSMESPCIG